MLLIVIQVLIGTLFTYLSLLTMVGTKYTRNKFEQMRLPKHFRYVTGIVQLIGGCSMLLGIWYSNITIVGGTWIAMVMLVGIVLRIRVNDSLVSTIPAMTIGILSIVIIMGDNMKLKLCETLEGI